MRVENKQGRRRLLIISVGETGLHVAPNPTLCRTFEFASAAMAKSMLCSLS